MRKKERRCDVISNNTTTRDGYVPVWKRHIFHNFHDDKQTQIGIHTLSISHFCLTVSGTWLNGSIVLCSMMGGIKLTGYFILAVKEDRSNLSFLWEWNEYIKWEFGIQFQRRTELVFSAHRINYIWLLCLLPARSVFFVFQFESDRNRRLL